ncbi:MAG: ABC transporter permease [Bacillota bacterium]|nr:ABC transporter permease [Bacillota bacterium]
MRLFLLPLKNAYIGWRRSLTLGTFIFIVSILLVIFNMFIMTVKSNMQNAIINSLTGDIQLRSAGTEEKDMFSTSGNWGKASILDNEQVNTIKNTVNRFDKRIVIYDRIRYNAFFESDKAKDAFMFIGMDPKNDQYKKAFKLEEGRYLEPGNLNEIVLSKTQAKSLDVKPGDNIKAYSKTINGDMVSKTLKVVGIGDFELLSSFSFSVAYVHVESARELAGLRSGEATDVITYIPDKGKTDEIAGEIASSLDKVKLDKSKVKLTTWKDMGGFVMGLITLITMMFYCFIIILMIIVAILIINLIFMIGMERRQEMGTLRAIGFGVFRIVTIFMSEIIFIALSFSILGVLAGAGITLYFSQNPILASPPWDFAMGKRFFFNFDYWQIIYVLGIVMVFTFIASYYPSYKAASLKPVDTLKEE